MSKEWSFRMFGELWTAVNFKTQELLVAPTREELERIVYEITGSTDDERRSTTTH